MSHPSITATTIKHFQRGHVVAYTQHNPFLGIMERKGKIRTGLSGTSYDWVVSVGRNAGTAVDDMEDISSKLVRRNEEIRANLPWSHLANGCAVSKQEFREQGKDTALYMLRNDRIPRMVESMLDDNIAYGILNNDDPTDNDLIGLESIFNYTAGTEKSNLESGATLASNDTYAGHSTALSGLTGVDGAESDAWTPALVNTGHTGWANGAGLDVDVVQYAILLSKRGTKPANRPDCGIFTRASFSTLKTKVGDKERILVDPKSTGDAFGLGTHVDFVPIDGIRIFEDQHATGDYILNFDQIEFLVMQYEPNVSGDKYPGKKGGDHFDWFDVEVDYQIERGSIAIRNDFAGQVVFKCPRFQTKIGNFTS